MFDSIKANLASKTRRENVLRLIAFSLALLFVTSLFKNISYPLFWADESMTVMGGVRVLQFGYPKVHDGKNVFYDLQHPDKTLGIDRRTDAYIGGANWGQYYIAAAGVKIAELSDDIFTKTALIRTTFALFGLAGVLLLALLGRRFFGSESSKTGFVALFVLLELLSVPLALHLREARYYSPTVFLTALAIFAYVRYRILKEASYPGYVVLLTFSLLLLFITFSPAYFVFLVSIFFFESVALFAYPVPVSNGKDRAGRFGDYLRGLLPCFLSLIPVHPLMSFFDTLHISAKLSKYYAWGFQTDAAGMYLSNLSFIWDFFSSSDLLYLALFLKSVLAACFLLKLIPGRSANFPDMPKVMSSVFLSALFIVYFFAIPKIPNPLFTRYFIPLQPILTLIIIMDTSVLFSVFSRFRSAFLIYSKHALVVIFIASVLIGASSNLPFLRGHLFELTHRYLGPLDHVVPFIQERFPNTDNLVIATNYEETSFMYYLNAKVTVGYAGNNLEEDAHIRPDIIVYRKWWENSKPLFANFTQSHPYTEISFPIVDYAVNNIPELHRDPPMRHQFRTQQSADEWTNTYMFVKK